MAEQFIQQQIAQFRHKYPSSAPKKEIVVEMPKVAQSVTPTPAPKKSGVIQLQSTNFPKKSSESSESSEHTKDSEYSDNIASDSSESCACDDEGDLRSPLDTTSTYEILPAEACRFGQKIIL
jgi:hypothetical protein